MEEEGDCLITQKKTRRCALVVVSSATVAFTTARGLKKKRKGSRRAGLKLNEDALNRELPRKLNNNASMED